MRKDKINAIVAQILGMDNTMDFCTDPAEGWPVIYYNKISIVADCEKWTAIYSGEEKEDFQKYTHENPLLAAMVVFARSRGYKI